ncbi:MAG: hypothetical protein JWM57_2538 [Phycisphaerales bacterium]|nr:hypothetical protein [Phycisphaerales bacterium]
MTTDQNEPLILSYETPLPTQREHLIVTILRWFRLTLVVVALCVLAFFAFEFGWWLVDHFAIRRPFDNIVIVTLAATVIGLALLAIRRYVPN